ncbi:uncharacterized protein LOC141579470 isoform X8 [Camelus bactrianus]|uniref:Uncharacterized protein LOC141579470 isoform X8 n=1 Tax=Camelus bactrianus TaxID=9837 RepID=A0AC58RBB9_CAMBA
MTWSRTWRPCTAGYSSGKSSCSRQGSRSREERSSAVRCAVRDQGSGAWPCASPARSRSCPALRRVAGDGIALLSALPTGEGENHPEPRTHTEGLCSRGHDSAALAASGRARPSGKGRAADQRAPVSVGFKSTLGDDTDLICDRQTPLSRLASGNGLLSRTDLGISLVLAAFCEDLLCVPAKLLGFRIHSSSLMTALDGLAPPSRPPCCPTDAWSLDDCASSRPCPGSGPGRLHQRAGRHCARGQEGALRWELLSEAGLPHGELSVRAPPVGAPHCPPPSPQPSHNPRAASPSGLLQETGQPASCPWPQSCCTTTPAECPGALTSGTSACPSYRPGSRKQGAMGSLSWGGM